LFLRGNHVVVVEQLDHLTLGVSLVLRKNHLAIWVVQLVPAKQDLVLLLQELDHVFDGRALEILKVIQSGLHLA
jgi:hypothetical protein